MATLEFNIEIDEQAGKEDYSEIAERVKAAPADDSSVENPAAVPIAASRGIGEAAAIIAVALTIVVDVDNGLKAIEGLITRFKNLFAKSDKKSEQILAGLDASQIMINVDGVLVPLNKLNEQHLEWLKSQ